MAEFCFPDGGLIAKSCGLPEIYPFVCTGEDGEKLYASCLHFGEALSDEKADQLNQFLEDLKKKMEMKKNDDTTEDVSDGEGEEGLDSEKSNKRKKSFSDESLHDEESNNSNETKSPIISIQSPEDSKESQKKTEEKKRPPSLSPKRPYYIQKSFGIVSHYPFFSLFKVFLTGLLLICFFSSFSFTKMILTQTKYQNFTGFL